MRKGAGRPKNSSDNLRRSKNWNFVLYPESAPYNWVDMLDETHIEWVQSPLHDKDIDPTGEIKKAHYHVTLLFPSDKSYEQVKEIVCDSLKQPIPIKCQSVKGSIRYMVHKDNPDKYQYNWNDIICHCGADLTALCSPTNTERMVILKEIMAFIIDNNITEVCDLIDIVMKMQNDDWFQVICNYNSLIISNHIRSLRHKKELKQNETVQ